MFLGELISVGVAVSWTLTAICMEYASKRMGSVATNSLRLTLAVLLTGLVLLVGTGHFFPADAPSATWLWMGLSGFVGYVFGDFCLFYSYVVIGARFGQLFMTLAPVAASFAGFAILSETIHPIAILAIVVTLGGIALSILSRKEGSTKIKLPVKGVLLGIGAGIGQGVGIVLSKYGMDFYYKECGDSMMIPFAAGQIRMIIGSIAFTAVLLLSGKTYEAKPAFKDRKVSLSILGGTVFGPLIGVSFSLLAVRYTASGIASTLMALTPILILPYAAWRQKQKITAWEVTGAVISVTGASLFFLS